MCSNFIRPSSLHVLLGDEVACDKHRVELSDENILQHHYLCTSASWTQQPRPHIVQRGEVEAVLARADPGLGEDGHPVAAPPVALLQLLQVGGQPGVGLPANSAHLIQIY